MSLECVVKKTHPGRKNTETKGWQARQAGSQQEACQWAPPRIGQLASQQSSRAARQYWAQPASSQPARGLVCQPGGQPGSYQPEASQAAVQRHNRSQPWSHFGRQYHKNNPIPGKPRKETKISEQPGHRAVRPGGQPAAPSQLALDQPASRMTVSRLTVHAGSQPTGWPLAAMRPAS